MYSEKIPIRILHNDSSDLMLTLEGKGTEPQVVFSQNLLEFPAIMPFSSGGSEAEITIFNPMEYPIELYSLEFDKQYLEEEEVRNMSKQSKAIHIQQFLVKFCCC